MCCPCRPCYFSSCTSRWEVGPDKEPRHLSIPAIPLVAQPLLRPSFLTTRVGIIPKEQSERNHSSDTGHCGMHCSRGTQTMKSNLPRLPGGPVVSVRLSVRMMQAAFTHVCGMGSLRRLGPSQGESDYHPGGSVT